MYNYDSSYIKEKIAHILLQHPVIRDNQGKFCYTSSARKMASSLASQPGMIRSIEKKIRKLLNKNSDKIIGVEDFLMVANLMKLSATELAHQVFEKDHVDFEANFKDFKISPGLGTILNFFSSTCENSIRRELNKNLFSKPDEDKSETLLEVMLLLSRMSTPKVKKLHALLSEM